MSHCLVLNADATPLSLIPFSAINWQDAIRIWFGGNASVVEHYKDWKVHSPSLTINVPSVIMNKKYIKVSRLIKFSRYNVLLRDRFTCQYCNQTFAGADLTMDHVIPRYSGGKTNWGNIVSACMPCNIKKAHYTTMSPKHLPKRPDYFDLVRRRQSHQIKIPDASWIPYIGWDPKLVQIVPPKKT